MTIIRIENTNGGVAIIFYGSVAERVLSARVVTSALQVVYISGTTALSLQSVSV